MGRTVLLTLVLALPGAVELSAQPPQTIETIHVQGLFRMTTEAFLHALGLQVGEPYDRELVLKRYRELWKLGLFEDITLEGEPGAGGGMVLVLKVKERPVLTSVTYEQSKSVTQTEIDDRLKEREIPLRLGKPLDPGQVSFAEGAIRDLLGEKGFLNAEVRAEIRTVTESTRAVHFSITAGGKTRIRSIDFTGNEKFSDHKLKGQLKLTEERRWYWPWSAKNLYHPGKWDQDVAGVRGLYLNQGHLDVEVRPPVIDVREEKKAKQSEPAAPPGESAGEPQGGQPPGAPALPDPDAPPPTEKQLRKQAKRHEKAAKRAREQEKKAKQVKHWVDLTVPVKEGPQYTLGEVTITGNEIFPDPILRATVPLGPGQILRNDLIEAAVEQITRMYENRGHLYATVVRRIQRREGEQPVADVEITIEEDEPYYISRIEFTGNTKTHDRVLRREMLLAEGELFNRSLLETSQFKINQLGYYQLPAEAVVEPIEGENRVNVKLIGEERGRNEVQVGGGYSELDGLFFNGVYSTRNLLGRGQTVSLSLQVGGRTSRYQISFREPWFASRPIELGFSLFNTEADYGDTLRSTSRGAGVFLGKRVGRFSRVNLGYNWQSVSSETFLASSGVQLDSGVTSITTENQVSSVTPSYSLNTVNNPQRPTRGRSFLSSLEIAGGPLGGDTSFLKPVVNFIGYRRIRGTHFVGLRAQLGWVREWQEGSDLLSSNIEGVPRFERFWMGGETIGPRIFETRSITPLRYVVLDDGGNIIDVLGDPRFLPAADLVTSNGVPVPIEVGGDRFFLLQMEYVLPLGQQAELVYFVDAGDALFEDQSWGFETARVSTGLEIRFYLPIFPVPLRLIYGVPVRELEGDQTSNFTFSIGRSF